jgi:hypothetical protein
MRSSIWVFIPKRNERWTDSALTRFGNDDRGDTTKPRRKSGDGEVHERAGSVGLLALVPGAQADWHANAIAGEAGWHHTGQSAVPHGDKESPFPTTRDHVRLRK